MLINKLTDRKIGKLELKQVSIVDHNQALTRNSDYLVLLIEI